MIQTHYSQRIKDVIEDKKKTQKEIAEILNTAQSYYAQYENGHRPLPIDHLIALCKYYDTSPEYILGFTNDAKPLPKK